MMELKKLIEKKRLDHLDVFDDLRDHYEKIIHYSNKMSNALENNGKIFFCGNGGSSSDSQHLAAEFTGRFKKDRKPLPAIALNADTAAITCIANDFGYDQVFSRQLEALGNSSDILIAISTSGNSPNVINAVKKSKEKNIYSIGLIGKDGGKLLNLCDSCITVKSNDTARIQEAHIFIGHILCTLIEKKLNLD